MDRKLIDEYELGGEKVRNAVKGLQPEDLRQVPDPAAGVGKWTIGQVVVHLQDAELAFAHRIKRILAEDNPSYNAWDENKFIARLPAEAQSVDDAVVLIEVLRRQVGRILRAVPDADLDRAGTHNVMGRQTVADVLGYAVRHVDHHVKFIVEKREKFGKIMW